MQKFYIDPIWAAKTYNPNANVNSVEEVSKAANLFIKELTCYYPTPTEIQIDMFSVCADGEKFHGPIDIISEEGNELRERHKSTLLSSWRIRGISHFQMTSGIIIVKQPYDVDKAIKLHNLLSTGADELEYIEF
jgi:hypothetical protein